MNDTLAQAASGTGRGRIADLLLAAQGPMTVQEMASATSLHVNTVREHLEHLMGDGAAERSTVTSGRPGRPQVIYTASGSGPDVGRRSYHEMARLLAEHLVATVDSPGATAREIGAQWGRAMAAETTGATPGDAADELVRVLSTAGFAPAVEDGLIAAHNCPFRELAEQHPELVCTLHQGMMDGYLGARGVEGVRTSLTPFARPGVCEVHLQDGVHRRPTD